MLYLLCGDSMKDNLSPINIFDFDGTLTNDTWPKFWVWTKKFGYSVEKRNDVFEKALAEYRKTHFGDPFVTFYGFFTDLLVSNNATLSYDELMQGEDYIVYNPGVVDFLKSTRYKNYIVTCGLKDFLENLEIARFFSDIYGTSAKCDSDCLITGIDNVLTHDMKIWAIQDILKQNNRKNNDCRNVFYVGDGFYDMDALKFVHDNGGKAIFVYQPNSDGSMSYETRKIYEAINIDNIIDFCCVADYSNGSMLYNILNRYD